jgi:hypothetical protein
MQQLPGLVNFFGFLHSCSSMEELIPLFSDRGWVIRRRTDTECFLGCDWAELTLQSGDGMILHGVIDDSHDIQQFIAMLSEHQVQWSCEWFDDEGRQMGQVGASPATAET